ncbi:MAG TPA: ATP synthase F1 subunit gamma, partial [Flavobacterium sp.]|nr:ATP synthase F1 subunit gamma [Flavobacterium sp.]
MANLKEIRNRIASVSSTMQITSAMKMVSAAKLKKAQDAITAMRPYAEKLTELLGNLSSTLDADTGGEYTTQREVKNVLVVAITSNRGLAGAFNSNVIKEVRNLSDNVYAGKNVQYITIGKKGNDALKRTGKVQMNNNGIFDNLTFDNVAQVSDELVALFVQGKYDKIVLVYNQFKNAATQIIRTEQFLPLVPAQAEAKASVDYIFEPSKEEIVLTLIPKMLKTQLYKA